MKEQFLNLSGLIDLVTYMKLCIAQHKVIIPRASFSLFPETGDENNIYIDTSTNAIYRWNDTDKKFVLLAKPPRTIAISEGTNNGEITLKVDNIASNAKVHGLTSTAFTESNKFATAAQGAKADSAVQTITLSSGTKNGTIKIKVNNITTDNIEVAGLGSAAFSDIGIFAAKSHTHKKDEVGLGNVDNTADIDKSVKYATSAGAVSWKNITDKPTLFPSQQHNHDSLYYRKNEVDSLLSSKSDTGHTHVQFIQEVKFSNGTYSDPLNGTAVAIKASGGIASDLIYEGGKTLADKYQAKGSYAAASHKQAYTSGECTTYNADDNTMGVTPAAVKKAFGIFGPKAHTHKKSDITDFPTSLPASDVYAWAKAASKPSYTKAEVGLGNVNNTADADKSVKYATSAGTATNVAGGSANTTSEKYRHVWFSDSATETARAYNDALKYDPKSNTMTVNISGSAASAATASSVAWGNVSGRPSTFTPSSHTHTKSQITDFPTTLKNPTSLVIKLNGGTTEGTNMFTYDGSTAKSLSITPSAIGAAASSHTHNYAGSSSAGGSANSAVKLDTSAGSATQPVYFSGGKPVACSYTLGKSVPSNAVFTDTNTTYPISYRTIDNNFASKYRTQTKGNTSAGDYISTLRCETNLVPYAPQYGSGLGWGRGDTHGYLYMNYGSPQVYVGAGNADKLNWAKQLAFADHTHSYTEITNRPTLIKAVSKNGYWGMADHDGSDSNWIRTTTVGIIPYQSGGAGGGHCGLGTSSWYFSNAYIDTVNCVNASVSGHIDVGGYIQSSNLINTYFEYQSNRGTIDWRFGSATGTGDENFFGFYDAKTGKIPLALDGNFGNIYVGFNVGSYESPAAVGVYLGGQVAGNRAFIYNGDSYQGSIWIQTRLDGSWKWFSLGRVCSTALSDIRLKGDIRDTEVEDATKVIEAMQIRSFERKDSHKKYKIGFIADELEQLDPNLVDGGGEVDGHPYYKSVNNLQMLAYVVKGMQELNSKVTILEKENKRLKQKLNMCN